MYVILYLLYENLVNVARPITALGLSCFSLRMKPKQYFTLAIFDVSFHTEMVVSSKMTVYVAEPWWVNSLVRNPVVIPYTHGHKILDRIYLDTTFASKKDIYRKFPAKSAGLAELLEKVSKYPKATVFHFNAWTLGYEDVWVALSNFLRSQVR